MRSSTTWGLKRRLIADKAIAVSPLDRHRLGNAENHRKTTVNVNCRKIKYLVLRGLPVNPGNVRPPIYESGGHEFESLRARQLNQKLRMILPIDPEAICLSRVHNQVHDPLAWAAKAADHCWDWRIRSARSARGYVAWGCFKLFPLTTLTRVHQFWQQTPSRA